MSSQDYLLLSVSEKLKTTIGAQLLVEVIMDYCLDIASARQLLVENSKHVCVRAFAACVQICAFASYDSIKRRSYEKDPRLRALISVAIFLFYHLLTIKLTLNANRNIQSFPCMPTYTSSCRMHLQRSPN